MGLTKTTGMKKNAPTSKVTNKDTKITKRGRKKKSDVEVEFIGTIECQPQHDSEKDQEPVAEKEHEELRENEETAAANEQEEPEEANRAVETDVNEQEEPEEANRAVETDVNEQEEEPEGEVELSEVQPKQKKHRGPTKMKHIARDPNARERVEFNDFGDPVGEGSVKLSSYLGPLVREHVPVTFDDWRKISEEVKTVLWKSVQVTFSYYIFTFDGSVSISVINLVYL